MRTSLLLVATIASIGLVGCVGGVSSMGDDDDTMQPPTTAAKTLFDSNVYPILDSMCVGCHTSGAPQGNVTGFVGATAEDGYRTATGYVALVGNYTPDSAQILTKIAAGHNSLSYTPDQITKITNWLNEEVTERNPSVPPAGTTPPAGEETAAQATDRVTKQWSGCMTLANFNTADMANGWGNMQAQNNEQCKECHVNGQDSEYASDVPANMFAAITTYKIYMMQYFSVDLSMGTAAAKMMVNTASFISVSGGLDPHREHPRFNPDGSTGMNALNTFYASTAAALAAGTCGPSVLTH